MISKLLMAAVAAGSVAACSSSQSLSLFRGASAESAPAATASLPPAEAGTPGVQTAALSPDAAAAPPPADGGHVDAPGAAPHSHDEQQVYGEPGDPNQPARVVEISMSETEDGQMVFTPHSVQARAGEQVRFKLRNAGELEHEFVLATHELNLKHGQEMAKNPDMEHDDPNAVRLAAGQSGEILWKFTNSGKFEFACLIPGHRESGMFGLAAVI